MAWLYPPHLTHHAISPNASSPQPRMAWLYPPAPDILAEGVGWPWPGPLGAMGPAHAPDGLGRTPNPGLAVCAGLHKRARRPRASRGEGALLARHCLACARTHSRQRLGRTAERDLRRVPAKATRHPPTGRTKAPALAVDLDFKLLKNKTPKHKNGHPCGHPFW